MTNFNRFVGIALVYALAFPPSAAAQFGKDEEKKVVEPGITATKSQEKLLDPCVAELLREASENAKPQSGKTPLSARLANGDFSARFQCIKNLPLSYRSLPLTMIFHAMRVLNEVERAISTEKAIPRKAGFATNADYFEWKWRAARDMINSAYIMLKGQTSLGIIAAARALIKKAHDRMQMDISRSKTGELLNTAQIAQSRPTFVPRLFLNEAYMLLRFRPNVSHDTDIGYGPGLQKGITGEMLIKDQGRTNDTNREVIGTIPRLIYSYFFPIPRKSMLTKEETEANPELAAPDTYPSIEFDGVEEDGIKDWSAENFRISATSLNLSNILKSDGPGTEEVLAKFVNTSNWYTKAGQMVWRGLGTALGIVGEMVPLVGQPAQVAGRLMRGEGIDEGERAEKEVSKIAEIAETIIDKIPQERLIEHLNHKIEKTKALKDCIQGKTSLGNGEEMSGPFRFNDMSDQCTFQKYQPWALLMQAVVDPDSIKYDSQLQTFLKHVTLKYPIITLPMTGSDDRIQIEADIISMFRPVVPLGVQAEDSGGFGGLFGKKGGLGGSSDSTEGKSKVGSVPVHLNREGRLRTRGGSHEYEWIDGMTLVTKEVKHNGLSHLVFEVRRRVIDSTVTVSDSIFLKIHTWRFMIHFLDQFKWYSDTAVKFLVDPARKNWFTYLVKGVFWMGAGILNSIASDKLGESSKGFFSLSQEAIAAKIKLYWSGVLGIISSRFIKEPETPNPVPFPTNPGNTTKSVGWVKKYFHDIWYRASELGGFYKTPKAPQTPPPTPAVTPGAPAPAPSTAALGAGPEKEVVILKYSRLLRVLLLLQVAKSFATWSEAKERIALEDQKWDAHSRLMSDTIQAFAYAGLAPVPHAPNILRDSYLWLVKQTKDTKGVAWLLGKFPNLANVAPALERAGKSWTPEWWKKYTSLEGLGRLFFVVDAISIVSRGLNIADFRDSSEITYYLINTVGRNIYHAATSLAHDGEIQFRRDNTIVQYERHLGISHGLTSGNEKLCGTVQVPTDREYSMITNTEIQDTVFGRPTKFGITNICMIRNNYQTRLLNASQKWNQSVKATGSAEKDKLEAEARFLMEDARFQLTVEIQNLSLAMLNTYYVIGLRSQNDENVALGYRSQYYNRAMGQLQRAISAINTHPTYTKFFAALEGSRIEDVPVPGVKDPKAELDSIFGKCSDEDKDCDKSEDPLGIDANVPDAKSKLKKK